MGCNESRLNFAGILFCGPFEMEVGFVPQAFADGSDESVAEAEVGQR